MRGKLPVRPPPLPETGEEATCSPKGSYAVFHVVSPTPLCVFLVAAVGGAVDWWRLVGEGGRSV